MPRLLRKLYHRKLNFFIYLLIIASIVLITNQISILKILLRDSKLEVITPAPLIRGTHPEQLQFYKNINGSFQCITSKETISFNKVNDDYCDCLDGSDEPGTSACSNGLFFCDTQIVFGNFPKVISSSKVNDGICDCCDGSDEWKKNVQAAVAGEKLTYKRHCENLCK